MSTRLHTVSRKLALIAFAVAMLAPAAAQAQNTCTVDSLADGSGSTTLRARIEDSNCDIINFSVQGTITLSEPLGISRDLTITGPDTVAFSGLVANQPGSQIVTRAE